MFRYQRGNQDRQYNDQNKKKYFVFLISVRKLSMDIGCVYV
jgi:hypothetical protein